MEQPQISFIIPAYNAERFIERSVSCARRQTARAIEIIVVDDGSTDGTAGIVERLAAQDERIVLERLGENRGRLEARRAGVNLARGAFTLFVDADDEIAPDMAQTLLDAQSGRFDIVQCDFEMRYRHYVSPEEKRFNRDFNRPPATTAHGDDITHLVFRDRKTTWSLCGKLMRTALLKEALSFIPSSSLTQAEDACIFFIVSCLADSYRGLGGYAGYVYNIDEGGTDARWKEMSLEQFSFSCRYIESMELIRAFIEQTGRADALADDYLTVRREHARAIADKLLHFVRPKLRSEAYDQFASLWPVEEAACAIAEAGWPEPAGAIESIAGARRLACSPREIRTVAAFHYSMGVGGAERVVAELARVWHDQELNVVLFTEEPREACAFDLPESVTWVELPAAEPMEAQGYAARARAIACAIEEHHIDAFVYHQWWSKTMPWDMLLVKSLDVPFCLFCHSIYMILFYEARANEFDCSRLFRYADAIVVLSEADRRFWSKFNPRVFQTSNPVTIAPAPENRSSLEGRNVVWVGRLSKDDKQPHEALEIMARVIADYPDATLTLVGPAPRRLDLMELKLLARRLGIEKSVTFIGPKPDLSPYYRQASVHLLTSRLDGWCLVLAESKAFGLPCVMYEMDYLTLTEGNRGIVAVAQGDRDGAARAIEDLFESPERRRELGQEAFDHLESIAAFDLASFWESVFASLEQGSAARDELDYADREWNILLDGFKESIGKALDQPVPSYAKRKGYQAARAAWHRIWYR